MRIAITGARGLLGTEVVRAAETLGHTALPWGRDRLDVTDPEACAAAMRAAVPDWVVHCAAYTAVDQAESEPEEALRTNRDGTANVARACAEQGVRLLYVSSDYVFDGAGAAPYATDAPVGPTSAYGRSKLAGEREAVSALGARALIVRTGWLYGRHGRDFVDAMLRLAEEGRPIRVVDDQVGRPSRAANVARACVRLIESGAHGVYHVADRGTATWLDFATEIFRIEGLSPALEGVSTASWGAAAPRPAYSVLCLKSTEQRLGTSMQPWAEALAVHLENRRKNAESVTGDSAETREFVR